MLKIGIIIGSTRPGRSGETVARWVYDNATNRNDALYEIVDLNDYNLPIFDEPNFPSAQKYTKEHTKKWSEKINSFDGFIFVTPEYNHSLPASLKNAIDYLNVEWNNKAAAIVSYGAWGGVRAVEQLRIVLGALGVADVSTNLALSIFTDFENMTIKSSNNQLNNFNKMLNQLIEWSEAMYSIRHKEK